jgi:hypothetical protein
MRQITRDFHFFAGFPAKHIRDFGNLPPLPEQVVRHLPFGSMK